MKRYQMSLCLATMAASLYALVMPPVGAEVLGTPSISVTATSTTTQLTRAVNDLLIINDSASANEAYVRVFWCGEPVLAAVAATAPAMRLEPGDSVALEFGSSDRGNGGYCAVTHVTAGGETATLRVVAK